MTPELKNMQIEELRDEIERVRTVLIDGYRVRKWLGCSKITEKRLEELIDLVEIKGESRIFNGGLSAEYRADSGRFDFIILKARVETAFACESWWKRNPPPPSKHKHRSLQERVAAQKAEQEATAENPTQTRPA